MSRISGPGIDIVMTASADQVNAAVQQASASLRKLAAEQQAASEMASRMEAFSRPAFSAGGARTEFSAAARASAELRREQELLVSVQQEAADAATDWANSVGQNFIPATNEWTRATDGASLSIGKIASTLGWVTAAATAGYAAGNQLFELFAGFDKNVGPISDAFDPSKPVESLKKIDDELRVLQNRMANFEQAGMSPGAVSAFFESGMSDAIKTQQQINVLEAQRGRLNQQMADAQAQREKASFETTLEAKLEGEKRLAFSRLSLIDQSEQLYGEARREREALLNKATTEDEKKKIEELFKLRMASSDALADQYFDNLEKQKQAEKDEAARREQRAKEEQERDAQRADMLAKQLADAMKKANAEARKDFVESMRAVTQELAQQFENSTAAFRGIVEQQARTASRGVWREY